MNKKLALAFLIISFLVIGGTFEKATARELRSGMDLLEICTKNLPFEEGKKILDQSNLKILSAMDLNDAAKKIVEAVG